MYTEYLSHTIALNMGIFDHPTSGTSVVCVSTLGTLGAAPRQANWQLTTSREAVRESVENYQLRSEAAKLCLAEGRR